MAAYDFLSQWFIDAPIGRVFAAIEDAPSWPSWWKAVTRLDVLDHGGPDGIGSVTRCEWRSALGYKLTFDARVTRSAPPRLIEVIATGELVGLGRWTLLPESAGTLVEYRWRVATTKRWMNALAPVLRPAFHYNHAIVMRWGGEGLGRLLGARFEDRSGIARDARLSRS
ncbi:MAG TPA: SRPBCC family protein [Polyangiaceae bacterium]|nr:SRPBCC family protein [Polyangiaceae bacterium]